MLETEDICLHETRPRICDSKCTKTAYVSSQNKEDQSFSAVIYVCDAINGSVRLRDCVGRLQTQSLSDLPHTHTWLLPHCLAQASQGLVDSR